MDIWTVFWRDWRVLNRRKGKFLLSRMITPVLYIITFGWGLGRGMQVGGASYLEFLIPGIMALNAMNISFNAVGSSLNIGRLYHKTLEEYLTAPISSFSYVMGKVLAGTLQGLVSSTVILVLAYGFGAHVTISSWFLLALVLNCLVFAAMGFVAAMLIDAHEDMANFSTYVLVPMSFLCGTFFALDAIPKAFQILLQLLPLTHASHALRVLGSGGAVPWLALGVLFTYALVLIIWGVWSMERVRRQ
ncbi:MAG TPA: ABC transporter permease [Negativicutes bacterium]|jgi:ABC-type multidrug transport system permease subunit